MRAARLRRLTALAGAAALLAPAPAAAALPNVGHVWVVILENKSYDQAFTNNTNSYLWNTVRANGVLLEQYYGTGHFSLDNYVSLLSGQAPNADTQADCQLYQDVVPGIIGTDGQAVGQGCVYPSSVKTLVDQLDAKGLSWKGYMEDMGNDPAREPVTCGNPELNKQDPTQGASATDQYAARHNPFVYFHSILDPAGRCASHVVPLPPIADDLKSVATTPSFSFITPNLCNDGHDATPCVGKNVDGGKEGGLIAADKWLARYLPLITNSPAFKQDGLLMVTLDESGDIGTPAGATACCNEPAGLNTPMPGQAGPGGGRIGTVLLSPFITPGTTSTVPYNHYSALRSLEDLFALPAHLGYAAQAGLVPFGADVFNRPAATGSTGPTGATTPASPAAPASAGDAPGRGPVPPLAPIAAGDAGSLGRAVRLRLRVRSSAVLPARLRAGTLRRRLAGRGVALPVRLTGSDRLTTPLQAVLARGSTVVATTGRARTLRGGKGVLRLTAVPRARVRAGRYRLVVAGRQERAVVVSRARTLTVR